MRRLLLISGSALALAAPAMASMLWRSLPARYPASLSIRVAIDPAADPGAREDAPMDAAAEPHPGGGLFVPCLTPDSVPSGVETAALTTAPAALFRIAWGTVQGSSAAPERSMRSRLSELTQGHTPVILVPAATATVIIGAGLLVAARRR